MTIAKDNNIKKGEKIISQVNEMVNSWSMYAMQAKVSSELTKRIEDNLNTI